MTPSEFCYWLEGFLVDHSAPSVTDIWEIKKQLKKVNHEPLKVISPFVPYPGTPLEVIGPYVGTSHPTVTFDEPYNEKEKEYWDKKYGEGVTNELFTTTDAESPIWAGCANYVKGKE